MSVRLRRLKADYDKMCAFFNQKARIRVVKTLGHPAEKYQVEFLVTGLQMDLVTRQLRQHNAFNAEIVLTAAYPRMAPQCRMLTPVFHPNIAPHAICIGDHWAAGESLPNLVVRIAEMLTYQSYNLKSPLNGEAAKWAALNENSLPLEHYDFNSLLSGGDAVGAAEVESATQQGSCANCGQSAGAAGAAGATLHVCANHHLACDECLLECPQCHDLLCLKCERHVCAICKTAVCHKCVVRCTGCGMVACKQHIDKCDICGVPHCSDCLVPCQQCGSTVCTAHITKDLSTGARRYLCHNCTAPVEA